MIGYRQLRRLGLVEIQNSELVDSSSQGSLERSLKASKMSDSSGSSRLYSRYANQENEIYYLNSEGKIEVKNSRKGDDGIKYVNIGNDDARLKVRCYLPLAHSLHLLAHSLTDVEGVLLHSH